MERDREGEEGGGRWEMESAGGGGRRNRDGGGRREWERERTGGRGGTRLLIRLSWRRRVGRLLPREIRPPKGRHDGGGRSGILADI